MPATSTEILAARVARGAALLDALDPGWHAYVDPDRLRIDSLDDDIFGQLYGIPYTEGMPRLIAKYQGPYRGFSCADHGFTLYGEEQNADIVQVMAWFADLTKLWRDAIARRQTEKGD